MHIRQSPGSCMQGFAGHYREMKKFLLAIATMAACCGANAAVGDTFVVDGVTYKIESETTAGISGIDTSLTSVTLTETVNYEGVDYTVDAILDRAFYWSSVTDVVLPSTIKSIGYYAFGSSSVATLTLNDGLESIGDYAFYACRSLANVVIPESVTSMSENYGSTFGTCYALESITLSSNCKKIPASCFYHSGLLSIDIPEGVEEIGKNAFNACDKMTSATIPSSLTVVGVGAFGDCKVLSALNGDMNNVTSIGEEAFFNTALTEFTFPDALEELGPRAFSNSSVAKFNLNQSENFALDGNVLYQKSGSNPYYLATAFPPKAEQTEVVIKDGCAGINGGAFQGSGVESVTMPSSVIAIDEFAFCQSALNSITFSPNVVYIGQQAFASTNITSMELPKGLRSMSDALFAGCKSLTSVTIGSNVTSMGIRQFYQCTALTDIYFKGATVPEVDYWEYSAEAPFYGVASSSVTIHCPKGLAAAYSSEYGGYSAIKEVVDSEPGILVPSSIEPADKSDVATLDKIVFHTDVDAQVATQYPAVKVLCGKLISGIPMGDEVAVGSWRAWGSDSKALQIVPLDEYAEGGEPVNMEEGKEYFVIIPAGVFKDAEGNLNEEITLHYYGTYVEPVFMPVSVEPAEGSLLAQIDNVYLTFESTVSKSYNAASKIKLIEGDLVDGVPTGTETMGWADGWHVNVSGSRAQIFPEDYDMYLTPITLDPVKQYFLVVEEGAFRNSDYVYNKMIVVRYSGTSGVGEVVEAQSVAYSVGDAIKVVLGGSANVQLYNAAGILVNSVAGAEGEISFDSLAKGVYVVRIDNGKEVKTVKLAI